MKLIEYQNMRGGRVVFQEIAKPAAQEWSSALHAVGTLYLLIHFLACFFPCLARNGGGGCAPLGQFRQRPLPWRGLAGYTPAGATSYT